MPVVIHRPSDPTWLETDPVLRVEDSPISPRHVTVTLPGGSRVHLTPESFHATCNVGSGTQMRATRVGWDG